ncbi:tyrosine-protein kinase Shark-like isoform X3 [Penaeus japonicus]|uniref:tyrosine-protein kinase Shark-like isoform X3 n=1 Tax=Penaeus japonicus TaxID=27405 RepID=UPI001C70E456|nr:tyrosine-protein kinase Shark-like isoform X3 [Penaeus japonicus]
MERMSCHDVDDPQCRNICSCSSNTTLLMNRYEMKMASSTSRSEVDEDRYFFRKITSEEANEILAREGGEEGTFLVRESCSSPGNYVLSFITEGQPIHILIQKYREDAFFSLVIDEETQVFHGLDNLVNHYCQNPVGRSSTVLTHPCCGELLPSEVRLHGSSSLLHRSTSQGNVTIVAELLKSGYKKIDDKNYYGQTSLHIASMKGYEDITRLLLQAPANVEVRDEDGLTPLHLASRYNRPGIVRLLVEMGQAEIQARTTKTEAVALHEAAEYGSIECVKELLALGAPSCPRNVRMETPTDLAKRNGHFEIVRLLVNHRPPAPLHSVRDCYHGQIDRHVAQERLTSISKPGHFLLRQSTRKLGTYVLTLFYQEQVYNYEVSHEGELVFIDDGPYFTSLESMINHYSRFMDGLPCRLLTPVPPPHPLPEHEIPVHCPPVSHNNNGSDSGAGSTEQQSLLAAVSQDDLRLSGPEVLGRAQLPKPNIIITDPLSQASQNITEDLIDLHTPLEYGRIQKVPRKIPHAVQRASRENLKLDLKNLSINSHGEGTAISGSSPTMDGNRTDEIFGDIDINRLSIGRRLGDGEFGSVLKGVWHSSSGDQIDVAVKILHDDDKVNKKNFLKEAEVMMNLNHLYIVKFIGVCHGPPVAMVQELMAMGSLLDFLLEHPEQVSIDFHLKLWAAQVAEGMLYLEQKHFVHRDLAARNILLSSMTLAKISDFGLSRALGVDEEYYTASEGGKWPLKWYAPESINYGTFTHSSDVWSYGITLWEMYTFGNQPYGELPGHKILELIEKNERLPRPEKCPKGVFELMLRCWNYKPKNRPSFRELATIFRTKPEYINIKHYFK